MVIPPGGSPISVNKSPNGLVAKIPAGPPAPVIATPFGLGPVLPSPWGPRPYVQSPWGAGPVVPSPWGPAVVGPPPPSNATDIKPPKIFMKGTTPRSQPAATPCIVTPAAPCNPAACNCAAPQPVQAPAACGTAAVHITTTVRLPAAGCAVPPAVHCNTLDSGCASKLQKPAQRRAAQRRAVNFDFGRKFFGRARSSLNRVGSQQAVGVHSKKFILDLVRRMKMKRSQSKFKHLLSSIRSTLKKKATAKKAAPKKKPNASKEEVGQVPMLVTNVMRHIRLAQRDGITQE